MSSVRFLGFLSLCLLATVASGQTITNAYPGTFVDISSTGTAITQSDDSTHTIVTTVGNGLFPAGTVTIDANGHVASGVGTASHIEADIRPTGVPTGLSATCNGILCAFWDDLYPNASNPSRIFWQEIAGVLYIQWDKVNHFSDTTVGASITFQVQIYSAPASSAPWIQYIYPDATFAGSIASGRQRPQRHGRLRQVRQPTWRQRKVELRRGVGP